MNTEYYILKDDKGRHYIGEGYATTKMQDATKYATISELISTVPLSRDCNCDYEVFRCSDEDIVKVKESEWYPLHKQWGKDNPEEYDKLYDKSTLNMFRSTYH